MVRFQKKQERKGRKAAVLTVLVLAGAGIYFVASGGAGRMIERIHPQIHKKMISVKPKILRTAHKPERNPFSEDEFTFFQVLNDPDMDRIVGLNGEVGPKHIVAPQRPEKRRLQRVKRTPRRQPQKPVRAAAPVVVKKAPAPAPKPAEETVRVAQAKPAKVETPAAPTEKKIHVAQAQPVQAETPAPPVTILPEVLEKFTVQVSSFKESSYAQALKEKLMKKGYPAFTQQSELSGGSGIRHRVYIGRYQTRKSAARAASKIRQAEKLGTLIVQHGG